MHEVGISHGDLHLKNILLQINDPQEINIYIIDFDKSSATSQLNENKRIQNLLRLNRSVEKYKKMGLPITRTDVLRFLLAYYQNPPNFRTLIRELTQRYKRHMRYHRLGGKILKLF
ncbi:MAG: lipopolysaccharide kinase InaA family protein, partial [Pseudomonadota bacterium]